MRANAFVVFSCSQRNVIFNRWTDKLVECTLYGLLYLELGRSAVGDGAEHTGSPAAENLEFENGNAHLT